MSKTAAWWAKDWMERHTYFLPRYDDAGRMVNEGHALASAAGIGARALVKDILPLWVGKLTGTVLVLFAGFCLVAAVWRELRGTPITPHPDIKPIPTALLVPMNFFLLLVAVAALVGIWSA